MSGGDFNVSELLASRESDQRASTAQRAGYLVRALVTVAVPLFLFVAVFGLDVQRHLIVVAVVYALASAILTFAYHNVSLNVKTSLLARRSLSSTVKAPAGVDKRAFLASLRQQQVDNSMAEATEFATLYNNLCFLLAVLLGAFAVFSSADVVTNFTLSVSIGAATASLLTSSSLIK